MGRAAFPSGFMVGRKDIPMLNSRKIARAFLLCADRPTFLDTVYKAKVTPRQREALYAHFLDGHDKGYIADVILHCSVKTVGNELGKAYDLLYNCLYNSDMLPH